MSLDLFYVQPWDGQWAVFGGNGKRISDGMRSRSDAVAHAKELARRAGSAQIVVYGEDGRLESEFEYQREERSALAHDDETATAVASQVAHRESLPKPGAARLRAPR